MNSSHKSDCQTRQLSVGQRDKFTRSSKTSRGNFSPSCLDFIREVLPSNNTCERTLSLVAFESLWGTAHLSANFAIVQMHQLVGMRPRLLLQLHGGIRKLRAHEETIMQVISTAAPPVPRLRYFTWNRTTRAQPQVSGGARPCYSVTYSGCGESVYKCRLPRSWKTREKTNKNRLKFVDNI